MERYIISIDQGTSSTKCILISESGQLLRRVNHPHRQLHPAPGFVEHDPQEILRGILDGIHSLTDQLPADSVAAISLSVQTGAFLLWDAKTGRPLCNLIGWQDTRGDSIVCELEEEQIRKLRACGYTPSGRTIPMKLLWMKQKLPQFETLAAEKRLRFGTVDSWLVHSLTHGRVHACNSCNASITRLFCMEHERWNAPLLDALGLPESMLPEVYPDDAVYGEVETGCGSVPIAGVMGDSAGAMFGQCCLEPGEVKVTYGTGASYLLNIGSTPQLPPEGIVLNIGWKRERKKCFVWEGTVFYAGAAMDYLRKNLKLPITFDGGASDASRLADSLKDNAGVYFVPSFTGLGVPDIGKGDGGCFCGLRPQNTVAHFARAAMESVGYQIRDIAEVIAEAGYPLPKQLTADGGGSLSPFEMQFQADILHTPVICSSVEECSALGAAFMGGLGVGLWSSEEEIRRIPRQNRACYLPKMSEPQRRRNYDGWKKAVRKVAME